MAKLGYTFYPKDWGNSEAVFELNLSERGLYRELIDLAMMNDNKTEVNIKTWCRKFAVEFDEINRIIDKLICLGLVEINDTILSVPSCENRLVLSRAGKKGGETSKPTAKHIVKPTDKPTLKPVVKGLVNQIEREREKEIKDKVKEKESKVFIPPTVLEVEEYFFENGYLKEYGRKAFCYYSDGNWIDGKGNKVLNWKQKMRYWFKDENKIKPLQTQKVTMASPII